MGKLAVSGLSKTYGEQGAPDSVVALRDVTFEVPNNQFCSILGHSGCGKTTLLNIAGGFEAPTAGRVTVDDDLIRGPGWQNTVIFQDYALFPWMSVSQNISFGLEMKLLPRHKRGDITQHYIRLVGLEGFENKFPHQLSGGMRQRVAIARALAVQPNLLLMDEPFAALDEQTRTRMGSELLQIWEKSGGTVVFVTHGLTEAIYLADTVFVMGTRPGRIIERITVPLPRPRTVDMIGSEAFGRLRNHIWHLIAEVRT